jgi:hypothetical protein
LCEKADALFGWVRIPQTPAGVIVTAGNAKYKGFPGVVERSRQARGMSGLTATRPKHRHPERSEGLLVHRATGAIRGKRSACTRYA